MSDFWNNLWNIVWVFFWVYAVVAYLIALIYVVMDIFRDRQLSGGLKAVWILLLVFLPFLTVLVYLLARGSGMAARNQKDVAEYEKATDQYIRDVAASPAAEIEKGHELLVAGKISEAEFAAIKQKALG